MHEMSLVRSLLRQVERLCEQHGGTSVEQIEIEIGPLSGVEPLLVREAFDVVSIETQSVGSDLIIHDVPLEARCRDCNADFEMASFDFVCPECHSRSIQITKGDEFRLLNVTMQTTEELPASISHDCGSEAERIL